MGPFVPWLLLLLSCIVAVGYTRFELQRRQRALVELNQARTETVEMRRALFQALADLEDTRHELKKKQLLSEALEEKLAKMAESAATVGQSPTKE
jgi:hypothetical protein